MMRGEMPWSLDPADAWKMICDGFNEDEIAHVGGLSRFQVRILIAKAHRLFTRNTPADTQPRNVAGAMVKSW